MKVARAAWRAGSALLTLVLSASALAACTAGDDGTADPPNVVSAYPDPSCPGSDDDACDDLSEIDGAVFGRACIPVPRFMLDVPLGIRWEGAKVRAIAAVPPAHAVAVVSPDPDDCGEWSLALREDLSPTVRNGIEDELRAAASLPPDPVKPGNDPAE